jgi:hypothetical protein
VPACSAPPPVPKTRVGAYLVPLVAPERAEPAPAPFAALAPLGLTSPASTFVSSMGTTILVDAARCQNGDEDCY